jgi:hypothetical protein
MHALALGRHGSVDIGALFATHEPPSQLVTS